MKVIITESQYNRVIDQFITYLLEPHEVRTSKKSPNSIFWVKGDRVIAEIQDSADFWITKDIWYNISKMFSLDREDTRLVVRTWLEQHYDLGNLAPKSISPQLKSIWVNIAAENN
jgi:hypothetical protein